MSHQYNGNTYIRCVNLLLCLILGAFIPLVGMVHQPAHGQELVHVYLPMLTRYVQFVESQGLLDPSFNGGGLVMTDLTDSDEGLSLAIQRDGRLLVGGEVGIEADYDIDMAVARYNLDGSLDATFGNEGWARTDLDEWNDSASDITLQPDGKILQSGTSRDDFALVRYNRDGSLDDTFGNQGWVRTDFLGFGDESKAVAVQPDGRILVAGYAMNSNYDYDFALVRYLANGSLDTSFGEDGKVTTDLTGDQDRAQALVIQPDGKIILVGPARSSTHLFDFGLVRYLPEGNLDPTFGVNGQVLTDFSDLRDFAYAVVLQPDGMIVVAGSAETDGQDDFAITRYTSSGLLDANFSGDGRVTMNFGAGDDFAYAVALQPDGKIIVAGYATINLNDALNYDFALVRYLANGSLDPGFGGGGWLVTDFVGGDDPGLDVALQLDGKIVVAGNASNGDDMDFALARYK